MDNSNCTVIDANRSVVDENSELYDRVSDALANNPYLANRRAVDVTAQHGRVVLQGSVNSFYQKQMAQELVRRVDGVREIRNELEVHWS